MRTMLLLLAIVGSMVDTAWHVGQSVAVVGGESSARTLDCSDPRIQARNHLHHDPFWIHLVKNNLKLDNYTAKFHI